MKVWLVMPHAGTKSFEPTGRLCGEEFTAPAVLISREGFLLFGSHGERIWKRSARVVVRTWLRDRLHKTQLVGFITLRLFRDHRGLSPIKSTAVAIHNQHSTRRCVLCVMEVPVRPTPSYPANYAHPRPGTNSPNDTPSRKNSNGLSVPGLSNKRNSSFLSLASLNLANSSSSLLGIFSAAMDSVPPTPSCTPPPQIRRERGVIEEVD